MTKNHRHFLLGFAFPFLISVAYVAIVLSVAASDRVARQALLGNPAIAVFQIAFVPVFWGLLTVTLTNLPLASILRGTPLIAVLLAFSLGAALFLVASDSTQAIENRVIQPVEFPTRAEQLTFMAIDSSLRTGDRTSCTSPSATAAECYKAAVRSLFNGRSPSLVADLGLASWWQRILSAQGALLGGMLFFTLVGLAFTKRLEKPTLDALLLGIGLCFPWLPLRLYSDWHDNFGSLAGIAGYTALWTFAVLGLASLFIAYVRRAKAEPSKALGIAVAGLSLLSGIVAEVKPEWLQLVGEFLSGTSLITFALIDAALVMLLAALVTSDPS